jgi:signal peptidase I
MAYRSLLKVIFLFSLVFALNERVFIVTHMLSDSMAPSLRAEFTFQDVVLVDRLTLTQREPHRGEIVRMVHRSQEHPEDFFFKRVAALPGEQIEIRNGEVLIDGRPCYQSAFQFLRYTNEGHASPGVVLEVASDSYFVLGDNSLDSFDSRYWGALPREDTIGLAALILWPPHRFGRVSPF